MKILLAIIFSISFSASAFANQSCADWANSSVGHVYNDGKFSIVLKSSPLKALDENATCDNLLQNQNICIKGSMADAAVYLVSLLDATHPSENYDIDLHDSQVVVISGSALPPQGPTNCEEDNGYDPCAAEPQPVQPICTDNGCYTPGPSVPAPVLDRIDFVSCS